MNSARPDSSNVTEAASEARFKCVEDSRYSQMVIFLGAVQKWKTDVTAKKSGISVRAVNAETGFDIVPGKPERDTAAQRTMETSSIAQ